MASNLSGKAIYEFAISENASAISLFTPYDLEVSISPKITVEIGRFSMSLLGRIRAIPAFEGNAHVRIGAFCEAAAKVVVLVGGEHSNSSLLNYSFGSYTEYYKQFFETEDLGLGLAPAREISIGDNVILSHGSLLLNSANIGMGTVIAAGAVVPNTCEPLGIYGGVPARRIRARFDERMADIYRQIDLPRICAHCVPRLPRLLYDVQNGHLGIEEFQSSIEYLSSRPKLHVDAIISSDSGVIIQNINAFSVAGTRISESSTTEKLLSYFTQPLRKTTTIKWSPDIFYALGLY